MGANWSQTGSIGGFWATMGNCSSGWRGAQPEGIDHNELEQVEKGVTMLLSAQVKPSFLVIQVGIYPLQVFCETDAGAIWIDTRIIPIRAECSIHTSFAEWPFPAG